MEAAYDISLNHCVMLVRHEAIRPSTLYFSSRDLW